MWLSESAVSGISLAAFRAHPFETGGVLVGVRAGSGRPWVTRAVEVPRQGEPNRSSYVLPPDARPRTIDDLRRTDSRLGYLGDWHSHPCNVGPSAKDIRALRAIAHDSSGECDDAILLVLIRSGEEYQPLALQLKHGQPDALRLVCAGDLPNLDPSQS